MIRVTRLDGTPFVLNAEWIQSIEKTPDTLITLTTGTQMMVKEPVDAVVDRILEYKRNRILERVVTDSERNDA